ncbi:MAG: hypothetical protein AB8I58_23625 [Anaerolineales bacterium]|jgi:archaellum component FlaC
MLHLNERTLDAYQQKVKAQIKEMKAKMRMFEAGTEKANANMRLKYQKNLDNWKSRFKEVEMNLDKLSKSAESSWKKIQSDIDTAMKELSSSIENATKQFNN